MKRVFLLFCSMLFLIACTHENPPVVQDAAILSDVAMVRVFDNTMSQSDLIRNAAEQFDLKQAFTRSEKEERRVKEIVPINGEDGEPAMYVVNYAENKGWVIVSASTDYAPILAHNDEGNFDVSGIEGNAIDVWVDETKAAIEYMKTAPEEEKEKYHTQWMYYASKAVPLTDAVPLTRDDASEALAYQNQCALQWEADGYDVYLLIGFADSQPSYVSNSLLNQIYDDAYTYGTDQYDGVLYNSFVLTTKEVPAFYGPYLQTKWHQNSPYNSYITGGYPVGCNALAVAQIMRYWAYPTTFNWNNMPNAVTTTTPMTADLGNFLVQIRTMCNTTYQNGQSISTNNDAVNAFHYYGYEDAELVNHDLVTVLSELESGHPVFMRGTSSANTYGHAWVGDGYYIQDYTHEVILKTMQTKSSFYTVNYGEQGPGGTSTYLHFLWGLPDSSNSDYGKVGYYFDTSPTYENTSYSLYRKDIINIYPTNN